MIWTSKLILDYEIDTLEVNGDICSVSDIDGNDINFTLRSKQLIRLSRWESHTEFVIESEGKFYRFMVSNGLTENEDCDPKVYNIEEVFPAEVLVTRYFNTEELSVLNGDIE